MKKEEETGSTNNSAREKEQVDFYFENGLMVMTEAYHIERGYCCGSKCRHCPYEHINVPNN